MGILPSEHREADFGNGSYGFLDFEDSFNAIDYDSPPVGKSFKINGEMYILRYILGVAEFVKIRE